MKMGNLWSCLVIILCLLIVFMGTVQYKSWIRNIPTEHPNCRCNDISNMLTSNILRGGESMKYRKKPVVIEAIQYHVAETNKAEIMVFIGAKEYEEDFLEPGITIKTLEGDMKVSPGDFVIKGIKGEFYPCKPDIFEQTYEKE